MALLIIPLFVTNFWQAMVGGHAKIIIRRIWPFLLLATATIWQAARALTFINPQFLSMLLGVLLVVYASLSLSGFNFSIASRKEKWVGAIFGVANGIFTGMTGSCVVPGVLFLQAIGLSREVLVQAMGMLFFLSTLALAFALQKYDILTSELTIISSIAVVPAITGMMVGQRVRRSFSEVRFRSIFFVSIWALGALIIAKAAFFIFR